MTRRSQRFRMSMLVAVAVVAGVGAFGALRTTTAAQTNARPNIVVVLVDDMGWSDIGPYGGEFYANLDAISALGADSHSYTAPAVPPTRASLLTAYPLGLHGSL